MDAAVDMSTRVTVVGLGHMGQPIAERILDAGFPLAVFNRTSERAAPLVERDARLLASPAEALQEAAVCITVLADDAALEAVVLDGGLLDEARPGSALVDMSTVSVAVSERVAGAAAEAGVGYLRAPVSGNPTVVRGGTLTIIVSGAEELARNLDHCSARSGRPSSTSARRSRHAS